MRRACFASSTLSRVLVSGGYDGNAAAVIQPRLLQNAIYGTTTARSFSSARSPPPPWFSSCTGYNFGLAGALFAVAGAASFFQEEAYAKGLTPPGLVPKEVVLYQYEACPFCNKVKGIHASLLLYFLKFITLFAYFWLFGEFAPSIPITVPFPFLFSNESPFLK